MLIHMKYKKFIHILLFILIILLCLTNCAGNLEERETDSNILQIQEAIKKEPTNSEYHQHLGYLYFDKAMSSKKINYLDKAKKEIKEAIRLNPENAKAHLLLAWILLSNANLTLDEQLIDEAKIEFQEGLRLAPIQTCKECISNFYLGVGYIYIGKSEKDKKYEPLALKELKESIIANPENAEAHAMMGRIYAKQNKMELALNEFREASNLNPSDLEIKETLCKGYSEAYLFKDICPDSNIIEDAINACKGAIQSNPEDAEYHAILGILYAFKGLLDISIFETQEAIKYSNNTYYHSTIGFLYINKGEHEIGIEKIRNALKIAPNDSELHFQLGRAYFLINRFEDAVNEFEKSLEYEEIPSGSATTTILHQYLSLKHMAKNEEAEKLLYNYAKKLINYKEDYKRKQWDLLIIDYYLRKIKDEELLSRMSNSCLECKAFFYIGYKYLLYGDKQKAFEYFQKSVNTKAFTYEEYTNAKVRLEQMKGTFEK